MLQSYHNPSVQSHLKTCKLRLEPCFTSVSTKIVYEALVGMVCKTKLLPLLHLSFTGHWPLRALI